jgi:hypothetical protein
MANTKSTGMPIEFTMDRKTKMHLGMGFLVLGQYPIAERVWPEFCKWSPGQVVRGLSLSLFTSVVKEIRRYSGVRAGWSFSAEIAADMLKDIYHLQIFFIDLPDLITGPPLRQDFEELYYFHRGKAENERAGLTMANTKSTGMPIDLLVLADGEEPSRSFSSPPGLADYDNMVWSEFQKYEPQQVNAGVTHDVFNLVVTLERQYRDGEHDAVLNKNTSLCLLRDFISAKSFLQSIPFLLAQGLVPNDVFWENYEAKELAKNRAAGLSAEKCDELPEWLLERLEMDSLFGNLDEEEEFERELDKTRIVLLSSRYARLSRRQKAVIHSDKPTTKELPEWLLECWEEDEFFENSYDEEEFDKELDKTRLVLARSRYARLSERQKAVIHSEKTTKWLS